MNSLSPSTKTLQKPVYRRRKAGSEARPGAKPGVATRLRRPRVNERFERGGELTRWPEMAQYAHDSKTHELCIFHWSPSAEEIGAVVSNAVEIDFEDFGTLCYLKSRLTPESEWQSAPVSYWLLPNRGALPTAGSPLRIVLVDGANGTIKAVGSAKFEAKAEARLLSLLEQQSHEVVGHLAMDRQLRETRLAHAL